MYNVQLTILRFAAFRKEQKFLYNFSKNILIISTHPRGFVGKSTEKFNEY
jgi:hypothetical protein